MARKGWAQLTPQYRQRLASKGITEAKYDAGVSIREARGHAVTPEHGGWSRIAEARQVRQMVPDWDSLDSATRNRLGKDWVRGFGTTGKPLGIQGRSARNRFNEWYERNVHKKWGRSDWAQYRLLYQELLTIDQAEPYRAN